jgi:hypothetical protein
MYTGMKFPVSTDGSTTIDFTLTTDPLSKSEDRFRVVFKTAFGNVLPVTFTNIKAIQQNKNATVQWKVENQLNVTRYEVEKSANGNGFIKVSAVAANGANTSSATYNWLDENTFAGMNYYRIKMIDADGKFSYSQIAKLNFTTKSGIGIYPNPVTNSTYQLQMTGQQEGKYQVNTYSSNGQKVCSNNVAYNGTDAVKTISLHKKLSQGLYKVEIVNPVGTNTVINIIVE